MEKERKKRHTITRGDALQRISKHPKISVWERNRDEYSTENIQGIRKMGSRIFNESLRICVVVAFLSDVFFDVFVCLAFEFV